MKFGLKIKAIRLDDGISQQDFAQLTDIPIGTLQNYEQEKRGVSEENLTKITQNPQFEKYALWLVTGKTAPDSGQVCPAFSIQEQLGIIESTVSKRA